jgi:hypothetical protein
VRDSVGSAFVCPSTAPRLSRPGVSATNNPSFWSPSADLVHRESPSERNTAFVIKEIIWALIPLVLHTGKRVLHSWLIVSAAIRHL